MKLGEKSALILSQHNSLVQVVSAALGGDKKGKPPTVHDPDVKNLGAGHATLEEAVAAINSAFSF